MTAEQFAYWMQGFAELTGDEPPTPAQWKSIREHLQTVFVKVTPPVGPAYITPAVDPLRPYSPPVSDWQRFQLPLSPKCSAEPAIAAAMPATCSARPVGMSDGCGTVAVC
jgi:hypothetical protein